MTFKPQLSENNRVIGQGHPKADLTDAEVDNIRHLHEEQGWSYQRLADKYETPKATIQFICKYRRRATSPKV